MFGQPILPILMLVIALVVFGEPYLPELGRSLGRSINQFKDATRDLDQHHNPGQAPAHTDSPAPDHEA
jgi:sec-independent protein translocase protein TatA